MATQLKNRPYQSLASSAHRMHNKFTPSAVALERRRKGLILYSDRNDVDDYEEVFGSQYITGYRYPFLSKSSIIVATLAPAPSL